MFNKLLYTIDFSWPSGEVKSATSYDPEWEPIVCDDSKGLVYYTNNPHTVTIILRAHSMRRAVVGASRYFNKIKASPTSFDCIFKGNEFLDIKNIQ